MEEITASNSREHLAWHETLEIHELVAFQSVGLMKLKKAFPEIACPELKNLYNEAIMATTKNVNELLQFYSLAPVEDRDEEERDMSLPFFAGDLLGLAKTTVRNYSVAITETATPMLRELLAQHLLGAIELHGKVFYYMLQRNLYPSYDLKQLLQNDVKLAHQALSMPY